MPAFITISLNIFFIAAISFLSLLIGYWVGLAKRWKIEKKIQNLENEMLNSHAEILRLSKEIADKEIEESKTLVVPLRDISGKRNRGQTPSL
jgi:hypothetical protein